MTYPEVYALCHTALSKIPITPALTTQLAKLSQALSDPEIAHEAIKEGGITAMVKVIKNTPKKAESGEVIKSTAFKVLTGLLSRSEGLDAVVSVRQELFASLYEALYDTQEIANVAHELFSLLAEFFEDSFELTDKAAKEYSNMYGDVPMAPFLAVFTSANEEAQLSSASTLCILMEKASVLGVMDSFIALLNEQNILGSIVALQKSAASRAQSIACPPTTVTFHTNTTSTTSSPPLANESSISSLSPVQAHDLSQHLAKLVVFCAGTDGMQVFQSRVEWLNHAATRSATPNISARAKALEGIAKVAGLSPVEIGVVQSLTQHLKDMEEKLEDVIEQQLRASTLAKAVTAQAVLEAQLQEQRESNQRKIEAIAQAQVLELSEQHADSLFLELESLKHNQGILLAEYAKNTSAVAEQHYLREHKSMWMFYQCTQLKLNELLLSYKVLSSKPAEETFDYAIHLAGEAVPLSDPAVAVQVVTKTVQQQRENNIRTAGLAVSVSSFEQIAEQCARVLAFRYEFQIRQLEVKGARLLGECGVRRLLEAMRAGCLDSLEITTTNMVMVDKLVDMMVHVEANASSLQNSEIATLIPRPKRLRWQEAGVFLKPGIKTLQGDYYSAPHSDVVQYGYRLGTTEEALAHGYVVDNFGLAISIDLSIVCFYTPPKLKATLKLRDPGSATRNHSKKAEEKMLPPFSDSMSFMTQTSKRRTLERGSEAEVKAELLSVQKELAAVKTELAQVHSDYLSLAARMEKMESLMKCKT